MMIRNPEGRTRIRGTEGVAWRDSTHRGRAAGSAVRPSRSSFARVPGSQLVARGVHPAGTLQVDHCLDELVGAPGLLFGEVVLLAGILAQIEQLVAPEAR